MDAGAPIFRDLGPRRLFEVLVFEVFRKSAGALRTHVESYCRSRVLRIGTALPDSLRLLEWLDLLSTEQEYLVPSPPLTDFATSDAHANLPVWLAAQVIERLVHTHYFSQVFPIDALSSNPGSQSIYVASAKVPGSYLPLIVLLRNLGLATELSAETGVLVIEDALASLVRYAAAKSVPRSRSKKLTIEMLKCILAAQEAQGARAEEFVVQFERKRLSAHPHVNLVRAITHEDVSAGYDVLSFEDSSSLRHDRFIEVKSYKDDCAFFWSRNERDTASELGESYYLYIVDIKRIREEGYCPVTIKNPFATLANDWVLETETWLASRKDNAHKS